MSAPPAVRVEGLWKRYGVPLADSLRRAAAAVGVGARAPSLPWALRDVHLEVARGESLGIIGRNGAGKSTLLKILAGVTPPSRGRVAVAGRVFPMIELNAGVNRDLTGRENVELLGAIMGFGPRALRTRMPAIEAFCELGEWLDRPARQYSSGMLARLGFAVATNVEADVVLVDEVLAVGDFAFQKKCVQRIARLASDGATVVFVSHNPYLLERLCDRVVMLREGALEELGDPGDAIHRYHESASPSDSPLAVTLRPARERPGSGDLRIGAVEILDAHGRPAEGIRTGDAITLRLHFETREPVHEPNFGIRIYDPLNTLIAAFESTRERRGVTLSGKGRVDCAIPRLPLMPEVYTLQVKVAGDVLHDLVENAAHLDVRARPEVTLASGGKGLVHADARWSFA